MIPAVDVSQLSPPAQKIAGATAPEKLQEMAAKGIAPGVRPGDLMAVLVVLTRSEREAVRETAKKTLAAPPEQLLTGALGADLQPEAIDVLAQAFVERIDVIEKLLAMPRVAMETVEAIAKGGTEPITELVATNEDRLLKHPRIIELLYLNKRTRMSTADRLIDLASRNGVVLTGVPGFKAVATALQAELIPEPSDEPTPDDELFQETEALAEALADAEAETTHDEDDEGNEKLRDKYKPLDKQLSKMTFSQKMRAVALGTKQQATLLVRDPNSQVAAAAMRSDHMTENDAKYFSANRNVADEVLRVIAETSDWARSNLVKKNLVENPRTPFDVANRLVPLLREADLRHILRNKNVSSPVRDAAKRHLERRKN